VGMISTICLHIYILELESFENCSFFLCRALDSNKERPARWEDATSAHRQLELHVIHLMNL